MIRRTGFLSKRNKVMKMRNCFRFDRAIQRATRSPRAVAKRGRRCRLDVEVLEERSVPTASISIGDTIVKEQGNLNVFVPGNAAILEHPSGIVFGPDRNNDGVQD